LPKLFPSDFAVLAYLHRPSTTRTRRTGRYFFVSHVLFLLLAGGEKRAAGFAALGKLETPLSRCTFASIHGIEPLWTCTRAVAFR
jgi:hypothetical protein